MTIHIIMKNEVDITPHEYDGRLKIVKKIEEPSTDGIGIENINNQKILTDLKNRANEMKNMPFTFEVEVIGNFEYNEGGRWVKYEGNNTLKKEVQVSQNSTTGPGPWTSEIIRWYGSAPTYIVKEKENKYYYSK